MTTKATETPATTFPVDGRFNIEARSCCLFVCSVPCAVPAEKILSLIHISEPTRPY